MRKDELGMRSEDDDTRAREARACDQKDCELKRTPQTRKHEALAHNHIVVALNRGARRPGREDWSRTREDRLRSHEDCTPPVRVGQVLPPSVESGMEKPRAE